MLRTKKDVDRHVQDIFRKLQDENEVSRFPMLLLMPLEGRGTACTHIALWGVQEFYTPSSWGRQGYFQIRTLDREKAKKERRWGTGRVIM